MKINYFLEANKIRFIDSSKFLLDTFSLNLTENSLNLFVGENGSGKTTLSYIIAQFNKHLVLNNLEGKILYNNEQTSRKQAEQFWKNLSYTFQDPDCQYTELKVIDELNRTIPSNKLRESIIEKYQLNKFLKRNMNTLSYGEKQRLLWAREFASNKDFYILDEVGSYFDAYWQKVLFSDINELKNKGKTICIFGHLQTDINIKFDKIFLIENKEIKLVNELPSIENNVKFKRLARDGSELLEVRPTQIKRGKTILEFSLNFKLKEKELILIKGGNGSGKTSLLLALAGIIKFKNIFFTYRNNSNGRIVLQNPYSQTIESTISQLIEKVDFKSVGNSFNWLKELDPLRDPLSLSYGEQKAIHILSALHSDTRIILIDEFYTGLSKKLKTALEMEIYKSAEQGKGIIISSHPSVKDNLPYSQIIEL